MIDKTFIIYSPQFNAQYFCLNLQMALIVCSPDKIVGEYSAQRGPIRGPGSELMVDMKKAIFLK
jgi:hypothetical protein